MLEFPQQDTARAGLAQLEATACPQRILGPARGWPLERFQLGSPQAGHTWFWLLVNHQMAEQGGDRSKATPTHHTTTTATRLLFSYCQQL